MDIFPQDKLKEGEVLTEKDYKSAATRALLLAIFGWILSGGLIGILMVAYVFKNVHRARRSADPDVLRRAGIANGIATVYWWFMFIIFIVLLYAPIMVALTNLVVGLVITSATFVTVLYFLWKKKRNIWTRKKLSIVITALSLVFLFFIVLGIVDSYNVSRSLEVETINFKTLNSEEFVLKIKSLDSSVHPDVYKGHSALIDEVGEVWTSQLEGQNFDLAFEKTLPLLTSQGWTEDAARGGLSWLAAKSFIILARDPSGWCTGDDCRVYSDSEIRSSLIEDDPLISLILDNIFEEIRIDSI